MNNLRQKDAAIQRLRRYRWRAGRCFELSARIVHDDRRPLTLVHGFFVNNGWRGAHAWVTPELIRRFVVNNAWRVAHAWVAREDGTVLDPTAPEPHWQPEAEYLAERAATIERRYSKKETAVLIHSCGRWGPWHASAGSRLDDLPPDLAKAVDELQRQGG
jgi:hypothetical protein